MVDELRSIIKSLKIYDKNAQFNLQSMGQHSSSGIFRSGKYYVNEENREAFIKSYTKYVFKLGNEATMLECTFKDSNKPLFENAELNSNPIKIDIDLKFNLTDEERQTKVYKRVYTLEGIRKFVSIYVKYLSEYVEIPNDLYIYIMEKKEPTYCKDKDVKKDGLHIILPGYLVPNIILHKVRELCIADEAVKEIFGSLNSNLHLSDIIDKHVIEVSSWFLYGSGKPGDYPYTVSELFSIKIENNENVEKTIELTKKKIPSAIKLVKELSNLYINKNIKIKDSVNLDEIENTNEKNISNNPKMYSMSMSKISNVEFVKPRSDVFTPEYLISLIQCLSKLRAEEYSTWWHIGQSLYNIDSRNFSLWNNFSKQSIKYNESDCKKYWGQFEKNHIRYSSLHINYLVQLAKADNPTQLKKISGFLESQILEEILNEFKNIGGNSKQNTKIGCATFSKKTKKYIDSKRNKFHFISIHNEGQNTTWYTFVNHKWEEEKGAVRLKKFLKNEYLETFKRAKMNYANSITVSKNAIDNCNMNDDSDCDDDFADRTTNNIDVNRINNDVANYQEHISTCNKIIEFIESYQKRNELIRDLAVDYDDRIFHERLDTSTYIFVCSNGVLDMKPDNIHFRDGKPEDMMMRSTNTEFKTIDEIYANQYYQDYEISLQDFIDKVFPDPELQEYVLNIIAETLDGSPKRQELFICTGSGSNGKSVFFGFLQKVFGKYSGKTQPTLLTRKRGDTNAANPEMYDLRGKRIVYCEEPDEGEGFHSGILKELTGNDYLSARALFKHNVTFKPQFKLFISCNDKPDITSTDDGTWRRIKVINFISKFVDEFDYRLLDKNRFPHFYKKESVEHNYDNWSPIFLSQLFERYKLLAQKNFVYKTPDCVNEAIKEYKSQQNHFATFRQDRMIEDAGGKVSVDEAFKSFTEYAKESNFNMKECNKQMFRTNMERIIGQRATKGGRARWNGWSMTDSSLNDDDDDDDDDYDESSKPNSPN